MHRFPMRLGIGVLLLSGLLAQAAQPDAAPASLKMTPANAAFYNVMLRNREQVEAIGKSRAWAQLMNVPIIKQYWEIAEPQVKQVLQSPQYKETFALLGDMFSDEVFMVGGDNWGEFLELWTRMNAAQNYGPILQIAQGKAKIEEFNELRSKAMIEALVEHSRLVKVPDTVFGFHVADPKNARAQLKRLDELVNGLAILLPALQNVYKQEMIGGDSYLALNFAGSMVPWTLIPWDRLGLEEEQTKKLIKVLSDLKLSIHLGVHGNYVLLSLSGSPKLLERMTGKGSALVDRSEVAPLFKHLDRRVVSIGYTSRDVRQRSSTSREDYDRMKEMAKALLEQADIQAAQKQKILKDVNEQFEALKKILPEPGASLSYSFRTDKGQESYSIDFGKYPEQAQPRPLSLLEHLGGSPLIGAVGRTDFSLDQYKKMTHLLEMVWGHADGVIKTKLPPEAQEKYTKIAKAALPLLKRLDTITATLFLPSLGDGQSGLVLDARMTTAQWPKGMPKPAKPLPVPELGLVLAIRDPERFVKALADYRQLVEDAVRVVRELAPDADIPEFKFPQAETIKKGDGTLYTYPLPEHLGLDQRIRPVIAVGKTVATFTLSAEHAERLLAKKPLKTRETTLADPNKPLLGASVVDWAGILEAALPWIEYGVRQANAEEEGEKKAQEIMSQVKMVVQVLQVYKGTVSVSYPEEGRIVRHSISIIRDLAE